MRGGALMSPIVDPRKNLMHLIGQSIEDDVETYDIADDAPWDMVLTRDGKTYRLTVQEAEEP
jgi:hypothetical protein